ncbi:hypothetical protein [Convivina intestini]|uniref:hypothetical protein n=1 Tax=Convivina intestini TaxID=1505726 RepID=UPI00200BB5EE|nr:hypothetical protein [Convivina intestini]CAH1852489.1 hypothetical protein R078131_00487 [Convivina intestini]
MLIFKKQNNIELRTFKDIRSVTITFEDGSQKEFSNAELAKTALIDENWTSVTINGKTTLTSKEWLCDTI